MNFSVFTGTLSLLVFFATPAAAHIQLDYPTARTTQQKDGPCGTVDSVRGQNITELVAGETITIVWRETVNHPGHYRIAFDDDGQDDFVDPASFTDFYTNDTVLFDEIADKQGGDYTFDIVVPNTPCDNCTLQVVQVMTDKAPYGDGNDLYYQCADIRIVAPDTGDVGTPDTGDAGQPETDTGTDTDADTGANADAGPVDTADMDTPDLNTNTNNTPDATPASEDDGCSAAAGSASLMALFVVGAFNRRRRRR